MRDPFYLGHVQVHHPMELRPPITVEVMGRDGAAAISLSSRVVVDRPEVRIRIHRPWAGVVNAVFSESVRFDDGRRTFWAGIEAADGHLIVDDAVVLKRDNMSDPRIAALFCGLPPPPGPTPTVQIEEGGWPWL